MSYKTDKEKILSRNHKNIFIPDVKQFYSNDLWFPENDKYVIHLFMSNEILTWSSKIVQ